MGRLKILYAFYKSTLTINLSTSLIITLFYLKVLFQETIGISLFELLINYMSVFSVFFLTVGFLFSILHKELARKAEYYFYFNKGIGRIQLFSFCILLNFLFFILIKLIC